jgi:hypothetical protein
VEYWLVDAESGNAQGCYLSLDDALQAAEMELKGESGKALSVLAMRESEPEAGPEGSPETSGRLFVRFALGTTDEAKEL